MGSKISKNRESNNNHIDLLAKDHVHRSIPYSFVDTSEVLSSDVPDIVKIFFRSRDDLLLVLNGPSLSLVFLTDEKYLLVGSIDLGSVNSWVNSRRFRERSSRSVTDDLCLVDLHSGEMKNIISNSIRDISVSWNTEHAAILAYIGFSHLQFWEVDRTSNLQCVEDIAKRNLDSHATCCSISPNGIWLVVAVCSKFFTLGTGSHLEIYIINQKKLKKQETSVSKSNFAEIVLNLDFSSDSQFLALGSFTQSSAKVYFISTRTWQVIYDIGESMRPLCAFWPVFNPLLTHYQLITSTESGCLVKWDTSNFYNSHKPTLNPIANFNISEGSPIPIRITSCPTFSPDGNMFAIPLSDGNVIILDPNSFETLWTISSPDFQLEQPQHLDIPEALKVTSVCFSKSCEYLAIGHAADIVSLWLLPRLHFNLKHLCRTKIISMYPPNLMHKLPIPDGLKQYLLYQG